MDKSDLGKTAHWFGKPGRIVGMWFGPTYAVEFPDGSVLTIGEDRVQLDSDSSGS